MTFLNGGLLWLFALVAGPIILHLLFRQRFREVNWAPMRLLQLTVRRTKRRRRIEELLLLLLRVLAVFLIVLAVCRPALSGSFAAGLFGGSLERIVVIDDSLSMGRVAGTGTALDVGRDALKEIISKLPRGARVTILSATDPKQPILDNGEIQEDEVDAILDGIVQTDASVSWAGVMTEVADRMKGASGRRTEVIVLSDAQATGWTAGIADEMAELEGARMRYINVGTAGGSNLSLVAFDRGGGGLSERGMIRFRAVIRNSGTVDAEGVRGTLKINDEARPVSIPKIPAGQDREVIVRMAAPAAGLHAASFELPADGNARDNKRFLILPVGRGADIVIVDGEASASGGGTVWLETALAIGDEGWRVHRYTQDEWVARAPALGDLLILLDAAAMPTGHAKVVSDAVRDGRLGLMVFPGDRGEPSGALVELLPGKFLPPLEEAQAGVFGPWPADALAASLADVAPVALERVRAKRIQRYAPNPDAVAVGHWGGASGPPVLLQRQVGRGQTVAWSVGANREWSDWPLEPSWLLALRATTQALLPDPSARTGVEAGGALQLNHKRGTAPDRVVAADGDKLAMVTEALSDDGLAILSDTRQAGIMRFEAVTGQARIPHWFGVSPSALELVDADPLDASAVQAVMAPVPVVWSSVSEETVDQAGEFWKQAVLILFAVMIIEPGLTLWMTRNRGDHT